jgi:hypothetical protein
MRTGRRRLPDHCVTSPEMTANDDTPRKGENVSEGPIDYQTVGKTLLRSELERIGERVREKFHRAAVKADRDDLDRDDLAQLRGELDHAGQLVDVIEEAAGAGDDSG